MLESKAGQLCGGQSVEGSHVIKCRDAGQEADIDAKDSV